MPLLSTRTVCGRPPTVTVAALIGPARSGGGPAARPGNPAAATGPPGAPPPVVARARTAMARNGGCLIWHTPRIYGGRGPAGSRRAAQPSHCTRFGRPSIVRTTVRGRREHDLGPVEPAWPLLP